MKSWHPVFLLIPVGIGLSAMGGDPAGTSLLLYAGILLLLGFSVFLLPKAKGHILRHVVIYMVSMGVFFLIARTHFPFRVTFGLSESALHEIVLQVQAGKHISLPVRAGLFTIRQAGQKGDGSIYLWTDSHPSGPEGFVFRYTGKGYNLWSELKLKEDWYFICED